MVIAGVDSAETGGNIANLMFSLCLIFCGVLAQPSDFPRFWIFMYRLSPFTYLVSGMLSVGLANSSVQCAERELTVFNPTNGATCGQYMDPYKTLNGGYVVNPDARENCSFCAISDTNVFLKAVSSDYSQAWRNWGILWGFCIFNVIAALAFYWLIRMPKTKKDKDDKKAVGGHKGAVKEQALNEPSSVGSHTDAYAEKGPAEETKRYASITGDMTPPRQDKEIMEKV
jgi:ATP-binding cassette subfamily G (WHITE) protein 2 (PDR)